MQEAVAVQLLPYGWDIKEGALKGRTVREKLYKGMVVGLNATYFAWVNHDPADAFLRRCVSIACCRCVLSCIECLSHVRLAIAIAHYL